MTSDVLVAGIGNIFLGDDGFGPEVVRHLTGAPSLGDGVRVVDYGIRGLHLAYDLVEAPDALILVDALPGRGRPGELVTLEIGPDDIGAGELDAHGMDPVAVLATVPRLGGTLPPTYVVGCRPANLEEGIGLSPEVSAAVPGAAGMVRVLVRSLVTVPVRVGEG